MKKMRILMGVLAALITALIGVYPANAALKTVGPASTVNGFPLWYQDVTGLSLQPCLDQTSLSPAGGLLCILPGPVLADPSAIPPITADQGFDPTQDQGAHTITTTPGATLSATNFPALANYWVADVLADIPVTGSFSKGVPDPTPAKFSLRLSLTGGFQNGTPLKGDQFTFLRVNLQKMAGGLVPNGVYTVSIPAFGAVITFTADADGTGGGVGGTFAGQTFRNQINALTPFEALLTGTFPATPPEQVTPFTLDNFLVWDPAVAPSAPAGFIGDPQVSHRVVKAGDSAQVVVTFSGPGLEPPVTLTDFKLSGKILGLVITPLGGTDFGVVQPSPATATKTFALKNLTATTVSPVISVPSPDFTVATSALAPCGATLAAGATCNFDVVFSPAFSLPDGARTATISVTAGTGIPAALATVTGSGDGTAPTVDITSPTNNSFSKNNSPLLAFTATDVNPGTNLVRVDGSIVAKVSGNSLALLADGPHTVRVESTDAAGNLGFAETTFTVDTVAPVVAINSVTSPTRDSFQTISGSVSDANGISSVTVSDNGQVMGSANVTNGAWSFDLAGMTLNADNIITATATDAAGNAATSAPQTITNRTGTIIINGGAQYALKPAVTLSLDYIPAPPKMRFSFDNITWKPPVPFVATKVIALPPGNGPKTVHVQYLDQSGAVLNLNDVSASIILDTKIPTGTVAINNRATYTNSRTVTLSITALDAGSGVSSMCIKESAILCAPEDFVPFSPTLSYDITSPSDGRKTIRVILKDNAGKTSPPKLASIILDTLLPTGTLTLIAGKPALATPLITPVTLRLTAVKAAQMMISFDGGLTFGPPVKFALTKRLLLPTGSGLNTITVKFRDLAGNEATVSADIVL